MSSVVRKIVKYGGSCVASTLILSKTLGPILVQLQKIKTEEIITDERYLNFVCSHYYYLPFDYSITRRFEQSLIEGEARFNEEIIHISEMIKNYFDIEGLVERLRTCRLEEKKNLWDDMKAHGIFIKSIFRLIFSFRETNNKCIYELYCFNVEQG